MTDKKIIALDSQKLDAIESCMYKYKLKFGFDNQQISGYEPSVTPDYFERGGLLHKMLEPYYKLKKYKSRWAMNKRSHVDIIQSCINIGRYIAAKMNLDIAEIESVIDTFLQYTDFWENDTWNDIVAVESVGSKVLFDSPDLLILYEYKIDLILKINGIITPIDHKSAKSRKEPNRLSNQFRGYCWALGVNTLIQNEIGFQKTVAPNQKFRRHVISFSDSVIDEWKENAIYWTMHAISLIEQDKYPQNFTSCDKYSGCEFKDPICLQDPDIRDYKLQQFFKIRTWDVGKENL